MKDRTRVRIRNALDALLPIGIVIAAGFVVVELVEIYLASR